MANTLIHETRRLQFPLDTLVDALIELEDKQGRWPSKATVVGATLNNPGDGQPGAVLSIHRPESGQVVERRYSWPSVAAAIVNYCVKMRVPMPRNSSKSIQVLEDRVVLVLENTVILKSRHEELSTLPAGSVQPAATPDAPEAQPPASEADTEPPEAPPAPTASPPDSA